MFPIKYPSSEEPIKLSMICSHEDKDESFWASEKQHLKKVFDQQVLPIIEEGNPAHFSIFSLAPMPLLIQLGALFTDKISVDTYQPIREPKTWQWQTEPDDFDLIITPPITNNKTPVLVLSLSAKIDHTRIYAILGNEVDIWDVSTPLKFQHNDFIRAPQQLSIFRSKLRKVFESISRQYGITNTLHIFPAIPISCSIELGRIRMPKASMPWCIYDQNFKLGAFIKTIEIKV